MGFLVVSVPFFRSSFRGGEQDRLDLKGRLDLRDLRVIRVSRVPSVLKDLPGQASRSISTVMVMAFRTGSKC